MPRPQLRQILAAAVLMGGVTMLIVSARHWFDDSLALIVFLTAVLINAAAFGFWTGVLSALGTFGLFNFFFVEPHFTLHAARPRDLVMLAAFLVSAGLTGFLAGRLREQVDAARGRASVLEVLSAATGDLARATSRADIVSASARHLAALAPGTVLVFEVEGGAPTLLSATPEDTQPSPADLQAAEQAFSRGRTEFATAQGWTGSRLTFHPVPQGKAARLVFGHRPVADEWRDYGYREQAILSVLRQTEAALDRLELARSAEAERRARDGQALRTALLASLSHDLRTPLATILGSVTTLRDLRDSLPGAAQEDLLNAVGEEAQRLALYVEKLLQMTKIATGVPAQLHWVDPAECLLAAAARARRTFAQADIRVAPADLPLLRAEAALLEQALFNLIENALRHGGDRVSLSAKATAQQVEITVEDDGPGLPARLVEWLASDDLVPGQETGEAPGQAADRPSAGFGQGATAGLNATPGSARTTGNAGTGNVETGNVETGNAGRRGAATLPELGGSTGLGLPIAKGIARALGGHLSAGHTASGAGQMTITLPSPEVAPDVTQAEAAGPRARQTTAPSGSATLPQVPADNTDPEGRPTGAAPSPARVAP